MAMIHRRTMEIEYSGHMSEKTFAKLSEQLHKRGMSLVDTFTDEVNEDHYGFVEVSDATLTTFSINRVEVMSRDWGTLPAQLHKKFGDIIGDDCNYDLNLTEQTNTRKKWIDPTGRYINFGNNAIEGQSCYRDYKTHLGYTQENKDIVYMATSIVRNYSDITLKFVIEFVTKDKIAPATLKHYLEDVPLRDMKWAKSMLETRCQLKAIDYDTSDFTINCEYNLIAESTQQCSPSTVAKLMGQGV
tara:strand:+ start:564 stop:1295 length:732 start_codon:yes stop_codon:yes gene_type:complete